MRVNFWDCERYNGFSVDKVQNTWIDQFRGKLIVYPGRGDSDFCAITRPQHILSHFVQVQEQNTQSFDSGIVLIGGAKKNDLLDHLFSITPIQQVSQRDLTQYHIHGCVPSIT